jgi:gas vesicle protein
MPKYLLYFLILIFAINFNPLFAQEVEYVKEEQTVEQKIKDVNTKVEELKNKSSELADSLSTKAINSIDSLSNRINDAINNSTDSINNLADHLQEKVQSGIDSLQQRLNDLPGLGGEKLSGANEKATELTKSIDSLKNVLGSKLQIDKLQKYTGDVSGGNLTNQFNLGDIPSLDKRSIPGIPNLNTDKFGIENLSMNDNGLSSLTSQVNQRLGKYTDIKNNDWVKTDLPDYQKYTGDVKQYTEMVNDPSKIDNVVDNQAAQLTEMQTLKNETMELAAIKELPESMLADLKRYQDEQALKAQAKEEVVKQATDYFAEHQEKLSEAQTMMTELKKKYSYIQDSRDLSTAVKATSLKNEPFKKRIKLGLGFQIHQTNPISLDLTPNVLYRFNTLFSAGISGTYRASLGIENNKNFSPNTSTNVFGGSILAQHKVWKGFFAHTEFEYMSTPIKDPNTNTDLQSRRWNEGALLGIGKNMVLSKGLNGQIIFTYDFLHDDQSPNPKSWNIKFGLQLGNFKLKDINF